MRTSRRVPRPDAVGQGFARQHYRRGKALEAGPMDGRFDDPSTPRTGSGPIAVRWGIERLVSGRRAPALRCLHCAMRTCFGRMATRGPSRGGSCATTRHTPVQARSRSTALREATVGTQESAQSGDRRATFRRLPHMSLGTWSSSGTLTIPQTRCGAYIHQDQITKEP